MFCEIQLLFKSGSDYKNWLTSNGTRDEYDVLNCISHHTTGGGLNVVKMQMNMFLIRVPSRIFLHRTMPDVHNLMGFAYSCLPSWSLNKMIRKLRHDEGAKWGALEHVFYIMFS